MIKRIDSTPNVQINKPVKRGNTFSEVLQHEIAIRVDKVATQDGQVLYDRSKVVDFTGYMRSMAKRHNLSEESQERMERILKRGKNNGDR